MHLKRHTSYSYSDPSYISNLKVSRNKGNIIRFQGLNPIKWCFESCWRSLTQSEVYYCDRSWIKSQKQGSSSFLLLHCHNVPFHHGVLSEMLPAWLGVMAATFCVTALLQLRVAVQPLGFPPPPHEVKCTMEMWLLSTSISPSFGFSSTWILNAPHASSPREGNEGLNGSV